MRLATLAVLGLVIATSPALATIQRNGPQAQAPARTAQVARPAPSRNVAPARPAAARPGAIRPAVYRPATIRQPAQVQRSAPLRGQVGLLRDARAASASTALKPRGQARRDRAAAMRWTQGLPAPANIQANACPDGTMATLARGHDDIVRCMPM